MEKKQLVLVGNGMAGVRAIEEILSVAKTSFRSQFSVPNRIPITTESFCQKCFKAIQILKILR